jgi:uncharacterized protein
MNSYRNLAWILALYALLVSLCAAAPAPVPAATGLLVDQVAALQDAQRQQLEGRLRAIQESERAQIAVLISPGSPEESLAEYALRVAEAWKLGRAGRDDGLLIVLVPAAKAARIEVGYGLEGVIPDALAARWVRELLPALDNGDTATGLNRLLDAIEAVLPKAEAKPAAADERYLFPDHPEWRLPFVLAIFSPFALFPMFVGSWGAFASAPLLAAFLGGAAWMLWGNSAPTWGVAALAFALPLSWRLNLLEDKSLGSVLRYLKVAGNLAAVALFFAVIWLFVGAGLSAMEPDLAWAAPIFSGILALGLAAFLFPRQARAILVVLRSVLHFVFVLIIVALAVTHFVPDPLRIALPVAALFTTLVALALYADSHGAEGRRWSHILIGVALWVVVPFALFLLYRAALGEDPDAQMAEAAAGGGGLLGVLGWALRSGFFVAVKIGLGGRFGGGGAGGNG